MCVCVCVCVCVCICVCVCVCVYLCVHICMYISGVSPFRLGKVIRSVLLVTECQVGHVANSQPTLLSTSLPPFR